MMVKNNRGKIKVIKKDNFKANIKLWKKQLNAIHEASYQELQKNIKTRDNILATPENLKIMFCANLEDDLDFFNTINKPKNTRYTCLLVRNMLEQVIEFIYFIKNPAELTAQYFNVDINVDDEMIDELNPKKALKEFVRAIGRRYSNHKKNICDMAKKIDEVDDDNTKEDLTLYDMYIYLSEKSHNAYYFQMLDDIEIIEAAAKEEKVIDSELECRFYEMFVTEVMEKFIAACQ